MKLTSILSIVESRKNPDVNPKVSINATLQAYADKYGTDNAFVSFTKYNKLGINPSSTGDSDQPTPLGIYAYPLGYVLDQIGDEEQPHATLPFAGNQPYATAFIHPSSNILVLQQATRQSVTAVIAKLEDVLSTRSHRLTDDFHQQLENLPTDLSPGAQLWAIVKAAGYDNTNSIAKWAAMFKAIGYDGVIDTGDGIIHANEPTQAVFFSREQIEHEQRVINSYSPSKTAASVDYGNSILQIIRSDASGDEKAAQLEQIAYTHPDALENMAAKFPVRAVNAIGVEALANSPSLLYTLLINIPISNPVLIQAGIQYVSSPNSQDTNMVNNIATVVVPQLTTRSPELEAALTSSPTIAARIKLTYATMFFKGKRWPELEPGLIANSNPNLILAYAVNHMPVRQRWPQGEKILLNGKLAVWDLIKYATKHLRQRWIEAEPVITSNKQATRDYVDRLADLGINASDLLRK